MINIVKLFKLFKYDLHSWLNKINPTLRSPSFAVKPKWTLHYIITSHMVPFPTGAQMVHQSHNGGSSHCAEVFIEHLWQL